jgi:hypothetical protein
MLSVEQRIGLDESPANIADQQAMSASLNCGAFPIEQRELQPTDQIRMQRESMSHLH